jgi:hypothetical protein
VAADIVVSSNFSCAVFLNSVECGVEHPLVILTRHLDQ